jgi:hypothetical protein
MIRIVVAFISKDSLICGINLNRRLHVCNGTISARIKCILHYKISRGGESAVLPEMNRVTQVQCRARAELGRGSFIFNRNILPCLP